MDPVSVNILAIHCYMDLLNNESKDADDFDPTDYGPPPDERTALLVPSAFLFRAAMLSPITFTVENPPASLMYQSSTPSLPAFTEQELEDMIV